MLIPAASVACSNTSTIPDMFSAVPLIPVVLVLPEERNSGESPLRPWRWRLRSSNCRCLRPRQCSSSVAPRKLV
jgi:hypothetical protein